MPGSVVIQMEAVSPEPVVADGGQRNDGFLHGGYGHAGIGIGLELLGNRQDPFRIRVHWQAPC